MSPLRPPRQHRLEPPLAHLEGGRYNGPRSANSELPTLTGMPLVPSFSVFLRVPRDRYLLLHRYQVEMENPAT